MLLPGATGNLEGDDINSFGKRRLQQIQLIGMSTPTASVHLACASN